jgi:DNA-binding transcriptional MocR family regulator
LRKSKDHCIGYENTQGNIDLRKQIVKLAFNWGGKFKTDDIIVTSGCLEAINLCLRAVTQNGDTVAVESPNYFGIYQSLENMGLKVVEISSNPSTGLDIDCLEKSIDKFNVKACIVTPNFNNPSGSCMPEENKKRLVEVIHQT